MPVPRCFRKIGGFLEVEYPAVSIQAAPALAVRSSSQIEGRIALFPLLGYHGGTHTTLQNRNRLSSHPRACVLSLASLLTWMAGVIFEEDFL
jgi:hypothetical protein